MNTLNDVEPTTEEPLKENSRLLNFSQKFEHIKERFQIPKLKNTLKATLQARISAVAVIEAEESKLGLFENIYLGIVKENQEEVEEAYRL